MMKDRTRRHRKATRKRQPSSASHAPLTSLAPTTSLGQAQPASRKTIAGVIQAQIETAEQKKAAAALIHRSSYQHESRRPLVCLLFVLPMIAAYELATIAWGHEALRSGVDQWLDYLLSNLGFGQLVLLPVVMTAALIIAHHRIDDHWKIRFPVLGGMLVEAIGLGLMLFWAATALHLFTHAGLTMPVERVRVAPAIWWSTTMAMVGSGIYEELFFRLILLAPAIHYATQWSQSKHGSWIGIVAVSLLFAALHYNFINPAGATFEPSSFFFRFGASIVFSVLFLYRGFGIAVGTHVVFDVLTQI